MPLFILYLLPLLFPRPALTFFSEFLAYSFSSPHAFRALKISLVFSMFSICDSIMNGKFSGTRWPLCITIFLSIVAARALLIAFLLSFLLTLRSKLFSAFGVCALLPPTIPGATAPSQFILVPLLLIIFLGTLDIPRPYE